MAANIRPVLCTLPPREATGTRIQNLNEWIRGYARRYGLHLVDFLPLLVDPTAWAWRAGLTADNVHPNLAATKLMAQLVVDTLVPRLPSAPPPLSACNVDTVNLWPNGLCVTDTTPGGLPDSWSLSGGTNVTPSLVADSKGFGNLVQFVAATPTNTIYTLLATTGFSDGDTLIASSRVQFEDAEAGALLSAAYVRCQSATNAVLSTTYLWKVQYVDIADGVLSCEFPVPATTTQVRLYVQFTGGSGTLRLGQITLRNKTVLGL